MSNTPQFNIESIMIALIKTQAPFTGSSVVLHGDEADTDLITKKNRVGVTASDPTAEIAARAPFLPDKVLVSDVEIKIRMTDDNVTLLDSWQLAIETAIDTAPAAIVTLATGLFPHGFEVCAVTATNRNQGGDRQRERSKTLQVYYLP